MSFVIRSPVGMGDEGFILKAWRLQTLEAYTHLGLTDEQRAKLSSAVTAAYMRASVRLACAADDQSALVGFIAAEPERQVLHCVYVKHIYRRLGIGNALIEEFKRCKNATLWTRHAEIIGPKYKMVSRPSLLWTRVAPSTKETVT